MLCLSGFRRSGPLFLALKSGGLKVRERRSTGASRNSCSGGWQSPTLPGKQSAPGGAPRSPHPLPGGQASSAPRDPHRRPAHSGPKGSAEVLLRYLSARRQARTL